MMPLYQQLWTQSGVYFSPVIRAEQTNAIESQRRKRKVDNWRREVYSINSRICEMDELSFYTNGSSSVALLRSDLFFYLKRKTITLQLLTSSSNSSSIHFRFPSFIHFLTTRFVVKIKSLNLPLSRTIRHILLWLDIQSYPSSPYHLC